MHMYSESYNVICFTFGVLQNFKMNDLHQLNSTGTLEKTAHNSPFWAHVFCKSWGDTVKPEALCHGRSYRAQRLNAPGVNFGAPHRQR